jgi:hypothetical protein
MLQTISQIVDLPRSELDSKSPTADPASQVEAEPNPNPISQLPEASRESAAAALQTISEMVDLPRSELDSENPTADPTSQVGAKPNPSPISQPAQEARLQSAVVPAEPMSPLLKAIVKPDIHTAPMDRNRAIGLRWALRDIKSNRLKLLPVDQHDLEDLMDMGLIEMRNNAPVLTSAGMGAIS